jgi:hypothetical protein
MRHGTWFAVLALFALCALSLGPRNLHATTTVLIPSGTTLHVRTTQPVDIYSSQVGLRLRAVVDDPVLVDGHVVVPRGTPATLEVVRVERSSNMQGRDRLTFKVRSIHLDGRTFPVTTSYVEVKGPSEGKRATRKILGGAGIGAAVGGILGGGGGAAAGAAAGGATGAVVAGSGKTHLSVPAETLLVFRFSAATRIHR